MLLCFVRSQMFTFVQINCPVALFINLNYAKRIPNIRLASFKLKIPKSTTGKWSSNQAVLFIIRWCKQHNVLNNY